MSKINQKIYPQTKANIFIDFENDMKPTEVADKYDISISRAYQLRREKAESQVDTQIETVKKATPQVVNEVVNNLPAEIQAEAKDLAKGVEGLKKLEACFQETGIHLANRIKALSDAQDITPGEIHTLTKSFNEVVQAFNTSATTINMLNNNNVEGGATLNLFKSTLRN